MQTLTNLGSIYTTGPLLVLLGLWLCMQNLKQVAFGYAAIVISVCALALAIKYMLYDPLNPEWDHQHAIVSQYFPSGHVLVSVLTYGAYAIVASLLGGISRAITGSIAGSAVLIVGYSRIALVAHPWGDVAGGLFLGLMALWLLVALIQRYALQKRSTGSLLIWGIGVWGIAFATVRLFEPVIPFVPGG